MISAKTFFVLLRRGAATRLVSFIFSLFVVFGLSTLLAVAQDGDDTEAPLIAPGKGRTQVLRVFNGHGLSGWSGHEKYWSVEDGEIVGRNTQPVPVSTYLISNRDFSDFRLTFEFKLAQSEMHSGIAFWGVVDPEKGDEYAYAGHLVMFPSKYGFYELYGRNLIHGNEKEAVKVGRQHDWNRIEILAQGNRIRLALNGELISDWRDPQPERIKSGPIGLQLHSNEVPQEVRFRSMRLETFPDDRLVTLNNPDERGSAGIKELVRTVDPQTPDLWTSLSEVVLPDEILAPTRNAGLKTMGIREDERDAYFAIIQKAKETDQDLLHRAAVEFRDRRRQLPKNAIWKSRPPENFPSWVDLYNDADAYHGKLLTVHGHIRKLIEVPLERNPYGIEKVYEAWLYDLDSQGHPTVILATSIDGRLKTGTEVEINHCFASGYFFKHMGYTAQDASRYAPVLITGRLQYLPPDEAGTIFRLGRNTQLQILLVTVIALILGRHFLRMRKLARVEESQREAVREIVDQRRPAPTFESLADDGGTRDFAALDPADSSSQPDEPEPDEPEPDEPEPDEPEPDEPEPDQPEPDQPEPDQPEPDQPEPDQPEPDQPEPDQPEPDQPEPDQPEPDQPEPDQPEPDQPEPDQPEPDQPLLP